MKLRFLATTMTSFNLPNVSGKTLSKNDTFDVTSPVGQSLLKAFKKDFERVQDETKATLNKKLKKSTKFKTK